MVQVPPISALLFAYTVCGLPHSLAFNAVESKRTTRPKMTALPGGDGERQTTTMKRPLPRRALKKRKNKRRERINKLRQKSMIGDSVLQNEDYEIETRPVRRRDAIEAGLDYWMDETDVMKERQRKIAFKNRKAMEGEISKEKLREEVVAPYRQNWIGIFSLIIVMLSAVVTNFPELIQIPVIPIPDL